MLAEAGRGRIGEAHRRDAFPGVQGVGAQPERLLHRVLEKAVDDDDVAANELLTAGHPLTGHDPVMDDELEVEARDEDARVALALGRLADVAQAPPEREVAPLDRVLERRAVDLGRDHVDEGGVALELRELERRPQRPDHDIGQVGQDVLGVIQLDAREVARVATDVGDDEAG